MRERIYEIIDVEEDINNISRIYDLFMIAIIIFSILPLAFKNDDPSFVWIEEVTVTIFIIDYLLRLITADFKLRKGRVSFLLYPITPEGRFLK
jgi:voltage-gated potassium channel